MKCCVCSTEMAPGITTCPCCGFNDPRNGRVFGDIAALDAKVTQDAAEYRTAVLASTDIGVQTYSWKDDNGTLVLDKKTRVSVGKASQMTAAPLWLDQKFARIPDQKSFDVTLSVLRDGYPEKEIVVSVESLPQPELLEAGISVTPDMQVRFHVRNNSVETSSAPVSML